MTKEVDQKYGPEIPLEIGGTVVASNPIWSGSFEGGLDKNGGGIASHRTYDDSPSAASRNINELVNKIMHGGLNAEMIVKEFGGNEPDFKELCIEWIESQPRFDSGGWLYLLMYLFLSDPFKATGDNP